MHMCSHTVAIEKIKPVKAGKVQELFKAEVHENYA